MATVEAHLLEFFARRAPWQFYLLMLLAPFTAFVFMTLRLMTESEATLGDAMYAGALVGLVVHSFAQATRTIKAPEDT